MKSISVYILIGGNSNRFGCPKWRIFIDGISVLDRIWNSCSQFKSITLVGKQRPQGIGKHFVKDISIIQAPIIGLYTALKHAKSEWILLLSCDLPLMDKNVLTKLWSHISSDANIIVPKVFGKLQPTCSFYNKRLLNDCINRINNKNLSLTKFIKENQHHDVNFDKNHNTFLNMNSKNDMRNAKKILRSNSKIKF